MRLRSRALLLGAMLLLAGCQLQPVTQQERSLSEPTSPTVSFERLIKLSAELDERLEKHVRECMLSAGDDHLDRAFRMTVQRPAAGLRDPLTLDLLEAGPHTEEQAVRHGMVGTVYLFDDGEAGYVISKDSAYDSRYNACRAGFAGGTGRDADALVAEVTEMRNSMRRDLLQATEGAISRLLEKRLSCVRERGYPRLSNDSKLPMRELLASAGVSAAQRTPSPEPPEVLLGRVEVFPPAAMVGYTPDDEEIRFAATYARCGRDMEFAAAWEAAQVAPRSRVLAARQTLFNDLGRRLGAVLRAADKGPLDAQD